MEIILQERLDREKFDECDYRAAEHSGIISLR